MKIRKPNLELASKNGLPWVKRELMLAINLYCQISFGSITRGNVQIIELAKLLGRTPSSVSLKLANLASIDQSIPQKGLSNSSKLDRESWQEYFNDQTNSAYESEKEFAILRGGSLSSSIKDSVDFEMQTEGIDTERLVKTRVNQYIFRRAVLTSYNAKCCITGLDVPELLVASHIIPWSQNQHRLNPSNGLCLNALHDRAFDSGLITIDRDMRVIVSRKVLDLSKLNRQILQSVHGNPIGLPDRFAPLPECLEYHRQEVFQG